MLSCFGGGWGIRTLVPVKANGFQDFLTNPTLPQNNRKYQTIENAENPVKSRAFGVLSFRKFKTPSGARISVSKTISKTFLEKPLDKSAPISPPWQATIYEPIIALRRAIVCSEYEMFNKTYSHTFSSYCPANSSQSFLNCDSFKSSILS